MSFDYHSEQEKQGLRQGCVAGNSLDKTAYILDFRWTLA